MLQICGHRIGDAWYYTEGDIAHAFFLSMPLDRTTGWDIGHAVSANLVEWENCGLALQPGTPGTWDDKSLATGSVIRRGGTYWMAYTGHKWEDFFVQRVGLAFSDDLDTWEKLPENPTSQPDPAFYEIQSTGQRCLTHWRDPFIFDTGDRVLQYVCARRTVGDETLRGSIGLAQSSDMVNGETLPPPPHYRMTEEMETPQVYRIGSRYYLMFSTHDFWLAPSFKNRFPCLPFHSTDYAMVGESPRGPFHIHGTGEIIADAPPHRFYGSQLIEFNGRWFMLGTAGRDEGSRISDPLPVTADETGLHAAWGSSV